jgi:RHS repeat-associated protein
MQGSRAQFRLTGPQARDFPAQTVTHGSGPSNSVSVSTSTNRITSMGGYTFSYDANGNLTQDDLYKYKYDAENRLVELRLLNDTLVATYAVDGNSLRVSKVWSGERTWYIYAGTQLISEYEDAASATYSAGTNAGSAQSDSVSTILYQHADHLTTRLTTENSGQLGNAQRHYPYGEALQASGTADPSVLRKFTTYLKEEETDATGGKLNYAVFRTHSARTGRFLMADPVRGNVKTPQRLNRYAYVTNNPTNLNDPKGLDGTPGWFGWTHDALDQCLDPTNPLCGNAEFWNSITPLVNDGGLSPPDTSSARWMGFANAVLWALGPILPDWFPAFPEQPVDQCLNARLSILLTPAPLDCLGIHEHRLQARLRTRDGMTLSRSWLNEPPRFSVEVHGATSTETRRPFSDPRYVLRMYYFTLRGRVGANVRFKVKARWYCWLSEVLKEDEAEVGSWCYQGVGTVFI